MLGEYEHIYTRTHQIAASDCRKNPGIGDNDNTRSEIARQDWLQTIWKTAAGKFRLTSLGFAPSITIRFIAELGINN